MARGQPGPGRPLLVALVAGLVLAALTLAVSGRWGDGLLLDAAERRAQRAGGTWVTLFGGGPEGAGAVVLWVLALQVAALGALPLTARLLPGLPDRGYAIAKPLGLLLVATPVWLAAALHVVPFTRAAVLACAGAWAGAAVATGVRHRGAVRTFLRERWRQVLLVEAVFLSVFAAVAAMRAGNPDLFHPYRGGEKAMDLALLGAVAKSTWMPPYDPWFAGGSLNYYYFGQFMTAALAKALRIRPDVAYNVAVPTFAALAAVGAFSLGQQLAALTARARGHAGRPALAGVLAVALVLVAGSLAGVGEWLRLAGEAAGPFDYWRATREVASPTAITEFPFFTLLYGDLHAHLVAVPAAMVAASLAVALVDRAGGDLRRAVTVALLGVLVGALAATNSWDVPTQVLLLAAAATAAAWAAGRGRRALLAALLPLGAALAWAVAVFGPYLRRFENQQGGLVWTPESTAPRDLLVHFGPLLVPLVILLVRRGPALRRPWLVAAVVAAVLVAGTLAGLSTFAALVCLCALTVAVLGGELRGRDTGGAAACVIGGVALVVVAGAELLAIPADVGRMNTVFKFWFQAWWLLAVAAAYAVWRLLGVERVRHRRALAAVLGVLGLGAAVYPASAVAPRLGERIGPRVRTLDGSAYMARSSYDDTGVRYPLGEDRAVIGWLRRTVRGSPVVLEGVTPEYRWGSRISVYTGLPTVLGWPFHQRQQRGDGAAVDARRLDVDTFYRAGGGAEAAAIARRYDVAYVVAGRLERRAYGHAPIARLARVPWLTPVHRAGSTALYRIVDNRLPSR